MKTEPLEQGKSSSTEQYQALEQQEGTEVGTLVRIAPRAAFLRLVGALARGIC